MTRTILTTLKVKWFIK